MTEMNPIGWGLVWTSVAIALFLLPLLPAFTELRQRRDIGPIPIDDADSGETAYRLQVLAPQLPDLASVEQAGSWLKGEAYVVPIAVHIPSVRTSRAVRMEQDATADILISGMRLEMERGAQVRHLVHAESIVSHGPVVLNGRTSAESLVVLAAGSQAFRMAAPCIVTAPLLVPPEDVEAEGAPTPLALMPERHAGDLLIEAGEVRFADLVVGGNLLLGEGARVVGHVKAHGNIDLAEGASAQGALFAEGQIRCRGFNRIQGPISAGWRVELGRGTHAGSPSIPCSVSGWDVVLGPSVAVFGAIASVGGCHVSEEAS
ncbi:hypothetical protein SAMN05428957_101527 [Oryzisolibacter propanilivorax]|uniref:Polymer-forming protein n=1 Tax=Oryzisolibacter propanilivorax TaxID=1527607 RepID=A0A1G9PNG9_9BURK|nr:hypothetical protein [Oryzisolibacter propanilivorax]SDM00264.1 hypothetical protein SAMN05428957_101527 [Oryzisolibacter propanilivorax]